MRRWFKACSQLAIYDTDYIVLCMLATKRPRKGIKAAAQKLVRDLPGNASWDDLMYRIYVRQKIDAGLGDLHSGKSVSHESIRKEFIGSA